MVTNTYYGLPIFKRPSLVLGLLLFLNLSMAAMSDANRLGAKTNLTCIVMKRLGGNMAAMKLGAGQNGFTE